MPVPAVPPAEELREEVEGVMEATAASAPARLLVLLQPFMAVFVVDSAFLVVAQDFVCCRNSERTILDSV